jgi:hypothetical protein
MMVKRLILNIIASSVFSAPPIELRAQSIKVVEIYDDNPQHTFEPLAIALRDASGLLWLRKAPAIQNIPDNRPGALNPLIRTSRSLNYVYS